MIFKFQEAEAGIKKHFAQIAHTLEKRKPISV